MRPLWAEVDLNAIMHNCREVKKIIAPGTAIMGIVKANAYGHGALPVARALLQAGATHLGVASQEEGLQLRHGGITAPILILGFTPPEQAALTVVHGLTQTVYSPEQGMALSRAAAAADLPAAVHLKIDTGMGRLGFQPTEAALRVIEQLARLPRLHLQGIYTHLAAADSRDKRAARRQLEAFRQFLTALGERGIAMPLIHAANSAGIIDLPEAHFNLVRPGIILYGLYPSDEVKQETVALKPALSLKTAIIHLKEVAAGTAVSYGGTFVAAGPTKVATLPIGYADGLPRLLSNQGEMLVQGHKAPIIGRVCMDQVMLDVTAIPSAAVGDQVVVIGHQGQQAIGADELARQLGTINYEVLCAISHRVRREYIPENTREE